MTLPNETWEDVASPEVGDYLERIRVPGGWLYRNSRNKLGSVTEGPIAVAMCFVPDPVGRGLTP
jgi:hypothetical protein